MESQPIIAIIGRPNVGKSTLFNRLLGKRQAIVSSVSGTTRDRLYAPVNLGGISANLIDTAGLSGELAEQDFGSEMLDQVQQAVQEADLLLFVLDAQVGLTSEDQQLAEIIRKSSGPAVVYINKHDTPDQPVDSKLLSLGLGPTVSGSLAQRRGAHELIDTLTESLRKIVAQQTQSTETALPSAESLPRVALAGRPNVGKSSLFNAIVGEERVIVSDIPGTTRDTIDTKITLSNGFQFIITDTAGLRRRGKIGQQGKIERYSVMRTLRAIDQADAVILVVDASEGLTRGDVHVAMHAQEKQKPLLTAINKVDLVDPHDVNVRRFPFLTRQPMVFVSAQSQLFIDQLLEQLQALLHTAAETPDQSS